MGRRPPDRPAHRAPRVRVGRGGRPGRGGGGGSRREPDRDRPRFGPRAAPVHGGPGGDGAEPARGPARPRPPLARVDRADRRGGRRLVPARPRGARATRPACAVHRVHARQPRAGHRAARRVHPRDPRGQAVAMDRRGGPGDHRARPRLGGGAERLPAAGRRPCCIRVVPAPRLAPDRDRHRRDRIGARALGARPGRRREQRADRPVHRGRSVPDPRGRAPALGGLRGRRARVRRASGARVGPGEHLERLPVLGHDRPDRASGPQLGRRAQPGPRARRGHGGDRARGVRVARLATRAPNPPASPGTSLGRGLGGRAPRVRADRTPRRRPHAAAVPARGRGGRTIGRGRRGGHRPRPGPAPPGSPSRVGWPRRRCWWRRRCWRP